MNKQISLIMQSFSGNDYCICVYKVQSSLIAAYYYSRMGPTGQLKKHFTIVLIGLFFFVPTPALFSPLFALLMGNLTEKNVYAYLYLML